MSVDTHPDGRGFPNPRKPQNGTTGALNPTRGPRATLRAIAAPSVAVSGLPSPEAGKQRPITERLTTRMRAARSIRGMSAATVARELDQVGYRTTRQWLADVESGRTREVSVDFAVALSRVLGLPVDVLLGLTPCQSCADAPPSRMACTVCGAGRAR